MKKNTFIGIISLIVIGAAQSFAAGSGEPAKSAAYPSKPIELIVPFGAGGGTDRIARAVATSLEKQLGKPVVVLNKTAAAGVMGSNDIAGAAPDGYTLGVFSNTDVANFVYSVKEGVNFGINDFTYLGGLNETGDLLISAKGSNIKTLKDFIDKARSNPGKITVALPSKTQELAVTIMKNAISIDVSGVVYGGGSKVLADLIGGHVDAGILSAQFAAQAKEQGLNVLGLMLADRLESIRDIPTFAEQGFKVSNPACRLLVAPKNLPPQIKETITSALARSFSDDLSKKLRDMGEVPVFRDSDKLSQFLEEDFAMRKSILAK